ncbi:MAG: Holliday junction resolvase RuvX [Patescibacteria group bacterium]|nr:Holliday junction resolvase RuvX [Patescibacteria group bacterium]
MTKLLGLDIGEKRIGVAIAEEKMVVPFGIINNTNLDEAISEIGKICRNENILKIIIGIPKSEDSVQADKIYKFALTLAQNLNLEVDFVDESLTSKEAERELKNSNLDPKSHEFKEEVDKLSAKYILEQYINQIRNPKSEIRKK